MSPGNQEQGFKSWSRVCCSLYTWFTVPSIYRPTSAAWLVLLGCLTISNLNYPWVYFIGLTPRKEAIIYLSLRHSPFLPLFQISGERMMTAQETAWSDKHGQGIGPRVKVALVHLGSDSYSWCSWEVRTIFAKSSCGFTTMQIMEKRKQPKRVGEWEMGR